MQKKSKKEQKTGVKKCCIFYNKSYIFMLFLFFFYAVLWYNESKHKSKNKECIQKEQAKEKIIKIPKKSISMKLYIKNEYKF